MSMEVGIIWTTVLVIGLGTFALRFSFIGLPADRRLPPAAEKLLKYIPVAVLSALVLPALVYQEGQMALHWENHRLWAGCVAAIVGLTTRKVLPTIITGMLCLWLLLYFAPTG